LYIASELCSGESLADWISAHKDRIRPKLAAKIVMDLASSVGYAHARGVIHQDLKPANVLIDRSVAPGEADNPWPLRITDFGLACRMSSEGSVSEQPAGGTRRYMAPEQMSADRARIGTHTDVFALGVILHDLISHRPPARDDGDEPSKQATQTNGAMELLQSARSSADLSAIQSKCVHFDPEQRYRDGTELCEDLQRYLASMPVRARPVGALASIAYWIRRHPLAASFAGTLLVIAVVLPIGIQSMYLREKQLRITAESRRAEARQAVDEMYTQVGEKLLTTSGRFDSLQKEFLLKALSHYQRWAAEDEDDPERQRDASVAWHRVANMQARLGNTREAALARQKCLAVLEKLLERDPGNKTYRYDHFYNLMVLGAEAGALAAGWDQSELIRCGLQAYEEIEALAKEEPNNPVYQDALAAAARAAGISLWSMGRRSEGRDMLQVALDTGRKLDQAHPQDAKYLGNVGQTLRMLRQFSKSQHQLDEAIAYGEEVITIFTRLTRLFPHETSYRELLGEELAATAALQITRGNLSVARKLLGEALVVQDRLCLDFPARHYFRGHRAVTFFELARLEHFAGKEAEAEAQMSRALNEANRLLQEHPHDRGYRAMVANFLDSSPVAKLRDKTRAAAIYQALDEETPK
jgi:tetratricopeptide (TPR) repeat protein